MPIIGLNFGSLLSAVDDHWIRGFSCVEVLLVKGFSAGTDTASLSLAPFHLLAPSLKALYLSFMELLYTQTFDLIGSLPLLENLGLTGDKIDTNDDELDELDSSDESHGSDELDGSGESDSPDEPDVPSASPFI